VRDSRQVLLSSHLSSFTLQLIYKESFFRRPPWALFPELFYSAYFVYTLLRLTVDGFRQCSLPLQSFAGGVVLSSEPFSPRSAPP